jgi:hypothetical protein
MRNRDSTYSSWRRHCFLKGRSKETGNKWFRYNDLQTSYIGMQKRVKEREDYLKRQGVEGNSELLIL